MSVIHNRRQISIRAPTRGATGITVDTQVKVIQFQSALPRGERPVLSPTFLADGEFQSALPRGERRGSVPVKDCTVSISIRAPTRGATMERLTYVTEKGISIRAPTRGATLFHHYICKQQQYFNPRSHEGSDK